MVTRHAFVPRRGARRWLVQRLTGLVIAVLVTILALVFLRNQPAGFESWKALLASNGMRLTLLLLLFSLFVHAWIGIRDVLIDYVKPEKVSRGTRNLVVLALIGEALWSVKILWSL